MRLQLAFLLTLLLADAHAAPKQMQGADLSRNSAHTALAGELAGKLAALMKRHGDAWSFNSNDIVEEGGRLYRHATFYTLDEYRAWTRANPDRAK